VSARSRSGISIRAKLLLLSAAVLAIPWVGSEYVRELERYLRDSLEYALQDAARAAAGPLHDRADLLPATPASPDRTLYVHRLANPVQLDGYTDDWESYIGWSELYGGDGQDGPPFRFIISRQEPWFHALLQVRVDGVRYQQPGAPDSLDSDHVVLVFTDPQGRLQRYYFSPAGPGRIRPFRFQVHEDEFGFEYRTTEYSTVITGEWQPSATGFNLEMAIPTSLVGERLGLVAVTVREQRGRRIAAATGTAGRETLWIPGRIIEPSPSIVRMIERFAEVEGRRLWVLDGHGQVLASVGSLDKTLPLRHGGMLYRLVLPPIHERFQDDLAGVSRLQGEEVRQALDGTTGTRWRSSPDDRAIILSAATPVFDGGAVRGVVVVEETTSGIQMLQREAMITLFNNTVLVFLFITGAVLAFATRLSWRLRRLSRDAERAIDEHGRVIGGFAPASAGDEIGELSRTYAALLQRLEGYNRYLESMAGKLSHELRTPLAVVRSSLEHLRDDCDPSMAAEYVDRAREGVERLGLIVTRLSEAARLEQALQSTQTQAVEIADWLRRLVEGYRMAFPDVEFTLCCPDADFRQPAAPELLEQMMDKLVSNAVDFRSNSTPIEVALDAGPSSWTLSVSNRGPVLPAGREDQVFNSMVSMRTERSAGEPHLGLGLHIVRLIAEFHGASVRARNLDDDGGVRVEVTFPRR
jgi:two-component system sensor histidine kinase ChvG